MNDALTEHLIDTCPIVARGESPSKAIDDAAAGLIPGTALVIFVRFEATPLYTKLTIRASHIRRRNFLIARGEWSFGKQSEQP